MARGFLINDQIPGRNKMVGREEQGRTRGDYIPAHLPAMNPDKGLAKWLMKRRLADTGLDSGSAAWGENWMQGILAKGAMRHF